MDLSGSLSRTSKQEAIGCAASFTCLIQLSRRSDFQTGTLRQKECQNMQVRVGLYRIVNLESRRERRAQQVPFAAHDRFVIGEQRSAELLSELADRNATDPQFAIRSRK